MFFKLFSLLIIAYFIYRSLRNLINASLGGVRPQQRFQRRSRPMSEREPTRKSDSAVPRERSEVPPEADIEDAKWRDL